MVDELGWLWAEGYRADEEAPALWFIFDPDGRARGTVEMPQGLTVHQIGAMAVVGVWEDSLDVEHVRRHRLTRRIRDPIE